MRLRLPMLVVLACAGAAAAVVACSDDDGEGGDETPQDRPTEEARHGLTAEQASEVLVKVGDEVITVGEFADRLADQSPYLRARYNSPERRREFLDNLVRFELLAAEAERRGLTELPEVVRTQKQVMIQQLMDEEFDDQVQVSDISDEQVRAYYEEHRDEFQKPEQVRASHILIKNRTAAQRILSQILQNETDVSFFRRTAEQYNEDPQTRDRMGDLRFFSRPSERAEDEPEIPAAVAEAAFAIEQIGRVSPQLVQSDDGFHIVKLTGRRAALNRSFEEAQRPIQNRLWRESREQRIQDFIGRLREEADVEIDEEALSAVRIDTTGGSPTVDPHVDPSQRAPLLQKSPTSPIENPGAPQGSP